MYRGAAFADFDGDGRVDIAMTALGKPALVLRNVAGTGNHWIAFRLRGTRSNRDGIGAKVRVETAAGSQWNHATTAVGYASASERVVRFGLGREARVKAVEVAWPSGIVQRMEGVAADRVVEVVEPER
jgi:hypothetical protein